MNDDRGWMIGICPYCGKRSRYRTLIEAPERELGVFFCPHCGNRDEPSITEIEMVFDE
jgi:sarcosine oxidase delta subunit